MELEGDVLARRMFGKTLAELIEKRGEARIVSKAHARFDLLGFFIAEFLLKFLGDERKFRPSADGIDRATGPYAHDQPAQNQ